MSLQDDLLALATQDSPTRLERHYTISDLAYEGLYTRYVRHTHPVEPTLRPYLTHDSLTYQQDKAYSRSEGLSWSLFLLAQNYTDPTSWLDTRPSHVKQQHQWVADGHIQYDIPPSPSRRAPWRNELTTNELLPLDSDDHPAVRGTLRHKRCLTLDPNTRILLATIAKLHRMEPRGKQRRQGTLIATTLEAMGLGYITPPSGYELYLSRPNPGKYRLGFGIRNHWRDSSFRMSYQQALSVLQPFHAEPQTTFTEEDYTRFIEWNLPDLAAKARAYLDNTSTSEDQC